MTVLVLIKKPIQNRNPIKTISSTLNYTKQSNNPSALVEDAPPIYYNPCIILNICLKRREDTRLDSKRNKNIQNLSQRTFNWIETLFYGAQ
jgi:hypothetical protein